MSADTGEIQKTIREYYEQVYAKKFDTLEEMDNFLETYSPPKLNQEERDQLNRPITRNEVEYVIKTLPTDIGIGPVGSQANSTKHTKKNLYLSFLNFSKGLLKKEHSQRHAMKPSNPKTLPKKENYTPISLMNIDTKIFKILATESNISKRSYTMIKRDSFQFTRIVQYRQISQHHTPH